MSVNMGLVIGATIKANALRGFLSCALVGSAYTLGPEQAKDIDLLVLIEGSVYGNRMLGEPGGSAEQDAKECKENAELWTSYRDGDVNYLVTNDASFYHRSLAAAEVCKALRLENKGQRVAVYRMVRDGLKADNPEVTRHLRG